MFKGDRFIPFRGTQDKFMEEFIINNCLYSKDHKHKQNSGNTPTISDDAIRSPNPRISNSNQNELASNDNMNNGGNLN
jgi:hypothetical protein